MHAATASLLDQARYLRHRAALDEGTATVAGSITTAATRVGDIVVLVPTRAGAGRSDELAAAVRDAIAGARELAADGRPAVSVGCWTDRGRPPRAVTAAALSQGMRWGFAARWMHRELTDADHSSGTTAPPGVRLRTLDAAPDRVRDGVPFVDGTWRRLVGRESAEIVVLGAQPLDQPEVVGVATAHVGHDRSGEVRSALFDLGVAEDMRRRGIGRALVAAALRDATVRGATSMTLNATADGAGVYLAAGFRDVGRGRTWWLTPDMSRLPLPEAAEQQLVEAVATDSAALLDALDDVTLARLAGADAPPLRCRTSAMRLAAHCDSHDVVDRLIERGIALDVVTALELGRRGAALTLVAAMPRGGDIGGLDALDADGATLLHRAVQRDDAELVHRLLAAGAERDVVDRTHHMTPAGWAEFLGRHDLHAVLHTPEG